MPKQNSPGALLIDVGNSWNCSQTRRLSAFLIVTCNQPSQTMYAMLSTRIASKTGPSKIVNPHALMVRILPPHVAVMRTSRTETPSGIGHLQTTSPHFCSKCVGSSLRLVSSSRRANSAVDSASCGAESDRTMLPRNSASKAGMRFRGCDLPVAKANCLAASRSKPPVCGTDHDSLNVSNSTSVADKDDGEVGADNALSTFNASRSGGFSKVGTRERLLTITASWSPWAFFAQCANSIDNSWASGLWGLTFRARFNNRLPSSKRWSRNAAKAPRSKALICLGLRRTASAASSSAERQRLLRNMASARLA
mmetsp:Transcript_37045/g.106679  ORF Transcript_37045/g.106679 Transcript_37045/m.106679 type:complete len:309 (-) Transcript_37045:556-1482(-)